MDVQILELVAQHPQDWWLSPRSTVYTWGKGSWNQLGHSMRERAMPAIVEEWQDVQQVKKRGRRFELGRKIGEEGRLELGWKEREIGVGVEGKGDWSWGVK